MLGPSPGQPARAAAADFVFATLAVFAAILLCAALQSILPVASLALVFVSAVLVVALRSRRSVALFAAVLSMLAYNFFFTEPRFTFRISKATDAAAVATFLLAALAVGQIAARQRVQMEEIRRANDRIRALQALGERLAAAIDEAEVLREGESALRSTIGPGIGLLRKVKGDRGDEIDIRLSEEPAELSLDLRRLAEAMVQQVDQAARRTRLAASLESARIDSETERLRSALLSSVSHDLRSPLAAVIGAATSLSAYGATLSEADRRQLLETIRGESERLDRYIQNLLDMTRLGAVGPKLQRDWVSLEEIAGTAAARVARLFPRLHLTSHIPRALPLLWVHPALVEQALFNILENAAKFSPEEGTVTIRASAGEAVLTVEIDDQGPGIPEEERRRIFDMFYSVARGDRGARGTGLGLTIVRGMIGAHGGKVEALAGPQGLGTTIRVTLPVAQSPAEPAGSDDV